MTTPDTTGDLSPARADIAALQSLIGESRQLRAELRVSEATRRRESRGMMIFMALLLAFTGGLATLVWQNQRISQSNREISAQIADCTNQGGSCWEDSRSRSKTNVTAILNTTIFVAECLNRFPAQPQQQEELEACIRQELLTGRHPVPMPTLTPTPRRTS